MIRIAGVILPEKKRIEIGLTAIYGVGAATASKVLATAGISPDKRVKDLTLLEGERIREIIEQVYKVEGELRSQISQNVRRLKDIGSYRGLRHTRNLPVRGQRTKTNARTRRGKRATVTSGRKKAAEKT